MSTPKILICDDVEPIRRLAAKIIENLGYASTQAASGQEAMAKLAADSTIKLVLLDIVLPDVSGFDVMREIQRIRATQNRDIKVCFLSGKSTREDILKAVELGGDDYVIKPILSETLGNKVQSLLGLPKRTKFARVNVLYHATLIGESIQPDLFVTEISEEDISLRSTAGIAHGHQLTIRCPDLQTTVENKDDFILRVQSSQRQRSGVYLIKADFVGLSEVTATKLRSMAIRGSAELVEPAEF